MSVILAFTGASGAIYGLRLLQVLLDSGEDVHLSITSSGAAVLWQELGLEIDLSHVQAEHLLPTRALPQYQKLLEEVLRPLGAASARPGTLHYHHYKDFMAPVASGSFLSGGMVICPCSGTSLSAIAQGSAGNLVQRAAEVQLKERRRLVLVTREAPLSLIQLENMQRVTQAGGVILPASPGWYHGVEGIGDLVDFVVSRICGQLAIHTSLVRRWGEEDT